MASNGEYVVDKLSDQGDGDVNNDNWVIAFINEIIYSPVNLILLGIIIFLAYKIIRDRNEVPAVGVEEPKVKVLPRLHRDFTVEELRMFDGTQPDGRILIAVNGSVYDVTKGKRFYGPGGPYSSFAGRDASRNLATFDVAPNNSLKYDDLSDLSPMELDSVIEWELQFEEKYDYVGKLLKPNEPATNDKESEEESKVDDSSKDEEDEEDEEGEVENVGNNNVDLNNATTNTDLRKRDVHSSDAKSEKEIQKMPADNTQAITGATFVANAEEDSTDC